MKKLLRIARYVMATGMVLLISQFTVLAAGDTANENSLSAPQVFGGFALLALVILLPLLKKSHKKETV